MTVCVHKIPFACTIWLYCCCDQKLFLIHCVIRIQYIPDIVICWSVVAHNHLKQNLFLKMFYVHELAKLFDMNSVESCFNSYFSNSTIVSFLSKFSDFQYFSLFLKTNVNVIYLGWITRIPNTRSLKFPVGSISYQSHETSWLKISIKSFELTSFNKRNGCHGEKAENKSNESKMAFSCSSKEFTCPRPKCVHRIHNLLPLEEVGIPTNLWHGFRCASISTIYPAWQGSG